MAIDQSKILKEAVQKIILVGQQEFPIHKKNISRDLTNTDEILFRYATAKEKVIQALREQYPVQQYPKQQFALENWLLGKEEDEVAYFLNEAGSNTLNHSEFKAPAKFHLWLGKEGFVIGIEQLGKGFDAEEAKKKSQTRRDGGRGFKFFKNCKSTIFFDAPQRTKTVFILTTFK